jgi:O-antigen ligase
MALQRQSQTLAQAGKAVDTALAVCLCVLLAFSCLAFGGVQEWTQSILELGAALLFIVWAVSRIARPSVEICFSALLIPASILAAIVAVQLLLGRTAYWYATWHKALLWTAYGILLFLGSQLFRRRDTRLWFAVACSVFGFLLAMLAIAQAFAGNGKYYWLIPNQASSAFFGTYANYSHYAGLMEMLIPFPLLLGIARFFPIPMRVLFSFAAVIMTSSVFLSQSRGGIVALAVEIAVLAILTARGRPGRRQMMVIGLFCLFVVFCLFLVRPIGLWGRFLQLGNRPNLTHEPNRLTMLKDSLTMVGRRPLLGWGFGSFSDVYPSFRSFYTDFKVNAAHNDFAELAVETGLLGLATALAFIFLLYRTALRQVKHWRHDLFDNTAFAALVGCTGLIVHSFSDFNLQIPANAAVFFTMAAIATARALPERDTAAPDRTSLEDEMVMDTGAGNSRFRKMPEDIR